MKRRLLLWAVVGSIFVAGCETQHAQNHGKAVAVTPGGQIVGQAPPGPRAEVVSGAPSAAYYWVPGFWTYADWNWVWIPGHWQLRPHANALWVPGHWDKTPRGWAWTPGQWQ